MVKLKNYALKQKGRPRHLKVPGLPKRIQHPPRQHPKLRDTATSFACANFFIRSDIISSS